MALEVGTHSPWVSRLLKECGHQVVVANLRRTRLIYGEGRKTAAGFLTAIALTWPLETLRITGPAVIIPFLVWLITRYKYPVESKRVIAIYMFALAVQLIHMSEEYLAGFHSAFQHLFDTRSGPSNSSC